ncbi:5360_t:CDS:2 [Entrophospora sp. SA101]|nr:12682_t:CDS:2 [Entrophospora sp. SA101]CAJ0768928.1 5360_t:CDS:2 [Entrophospora sp. SA101]CAJ0833251.1 13219_t:CDS:2 [Entrophospora sp. SA101]CAJ0836132.1 10923_t:CDS:2 [Entrophospora sp. SA101]
MSPHKDVSIVTTNTIKQKNEKDTTNNFPRLNLKFNELDEMVDSQIVFEFGGPWGVTAMMIGFPILMYYLWGCLQFNRGRLESPLNEKLWTSIIQGSIPTFYAAKIYITFCVFEFFLAYVVPGPIVKGAPVSSLKGKQLDYLCNGVWSFYVTIFTSYILHYYELFKLTDIIDNFGPLMSVAIISGFSITFIVYAATIFQGKQYRMSGYLMYDLFMGAGLNPRIGKVDLKMDTANSQKNRFRMIINGTYIPRYTFPQLPWGTLKNPDYIKTKQGNLLLTSGWWGIARKIHYTADLLMAFDWGFITGFNTPIPFFYPVFFVVVLTHRVTRDMERCSRKYGNDWQEYCKRVPYIFIPGIY